MCVYAYIIIIIKLPIIQITCKYLKTVLGVNSGTQHFPKKKHYKHSTKKMKRKMWDPGGRQLKVLMLQIETTNLT